MISSASVLKEKRKEEKVAIELTDEQSQAVEAALETPARVTVGDEEYVLIRADLYDRVKPLLKAGGNRPVSV